MKKTIDGKKYDIETAMLIGTTEKGCNYTYFHFTSEVLYQKKMESFSFW